MYTGIWIGCTLGPGRSIDLTRRCVAPWPGRTGNATVLRSRSISRSLGNPHLRFECLSARKDKNPPAMSLSDGGQASLQMMSRSLTPTPLSTTRLSMLALRLETFQTVRTLSWTLFHLQNVSGISAYTCVRLNERVKSTVLKAAHTGFRETKSCHWSPG